MGHVAIEFMVFVIAYNLYLLLRHNRWDMLLLSTWCLLLHIFYIFIIKAKQMGHVAIKYMVFVIAQFYIYFYLLLRHNRWDMLL